MSAKPTPFLPLPAMLWQLLLCMWLGAHMTALLLFMPMLNRIGFAPLLLQEVSNQLRPSLLVLTLMATAIQMLLVVRTGGLRSLLHELRGQLLIGAWLLAMALLLAAGLDFSPAILRGLYGALLGTGLVLLSQPLPTPRITRTDTSSLPGSTG